ncbi:uncharacterized protein LOC143301304 [Babylonia areolata]|uniref:uncharacterized protein LOC143301304 n=1 Tax=Babylonia areolata TaxID=304850 RepID=UPI003FD05DAB
MEEIQSLCEVPKIAHFCSLFKDALDLPDFDIEELEESLLSEDGEGNILLLELIFKLLNGCYGRNDIGTENYEIYLSDIFNYRLELEQKEENPLKNTTFFKLTCLQKVKVLDHLCHFRLDADDVAGRLKGLSGECMRVEPLGVDAKGAKYWYFYGPRLYKEDPQPVVEETTKKSKSKKNKKRKKKGKGKQQEEDESSEGESMAELLAKQEEEEEEEELDTQAVKKAARLRVNLEKKEDNEAGDDDEEEIDLDLQDDVESLKFDLSSDEEEASFIDHSSDEDYSEKGAKKQKNNKRKKSGVGKTPKVAKTPKRSNTPQILRVTPRSARLRAKFGYADEDTRASNTSEDKLSTSSRSTTKSNKLKNKSKRSKKKNTSKELNLHGADLAAEKKESGKDTNYRNSSGTQQDEHNLSGACDTEVPLDKAIEGSHAVESSQTRAENGNSAEKTPLPTTQHSVETVDMDIKSVPEEEQTTYSFEQHGVGSGVETATEQPPKPVSMSQLDEDAEEMAEVDVESCAPDTGGLASHTEQSIDSSDSAVVKMEIDGSGDAECVKGGDHKAEPQPGTGLIKQEVTDGIESATEKKNSLIDDSQDLPKREAGPSPVSIKCEAEEMLTQDSALFGQTSTEDSPKVKMEEKEADNKLNHKAYLSLRLKAIRQKLEKEDTDSQDSRTSRTSSTMGERKLRVWEPRQESLASQKSGWHLVCVVTEDWEHLVARLEENGNRSQRALMRILRENFLPEIPAIQEEKEKERKKREMELAPRRLSTRLLYKKKEHEDRLRILREAQEEEDRLKAEEEEERRKKQEEEKREEQRRQREERERAREERAKRVKLREERAKLISEGKEIPPELMNGFKNYGPGPEEQMLDDEVVAKLHKVLAVCFKHDEAWPFVESVEEKIAPGYFDLIKMPMNLSEMEEKLKNGRYGNKEEFSNDMDLIVENCENYNGPDHDFCIMARNLREAFEQAMRRFFPVGRQKKEDEDFVLEGKGVTSVGRRYKARREASKKALDSFQNILSDADDVTHLSDHTVTYRPTGSSSLRNQSHSFQGYMGRGSTSADSPGTQVLNSMLSSGKKVIVVSQPTQEVRRTGPHMIEVRTIQPSTPSTQSGKPSTVRKMAAVTRTPGTPAAGPLTAILNPTTGDGATQKMHYVIPSSMVSLLKDQKAGEEGNRTLYVSINRPQGSQPVSATSSSVTSVLSTIHQSGGTVKAGKPAILTELGTLAGKSLLKTSTQPAVLRVAASSPSALGSSPLVVGGKSLLAASGNKPLILTGNNQLSLVGNSASAVAGNVQLVAVPGNSQQTTGAKHIQMSEASSSEDTRPTPNALHISKDTCLRLLAENKIKIVHQVPGAKPVFQLQPGAQLVQKMVPSSLSQGSRVVTTTTTLTTVAAATALPAASPAGSAPVFLNLGAAGSPRPMVIAGAKPSVVKQSVVVNPWSVNDKVVVSSSTPLSVNSVPLVQSAASALPSASPLTAAVPFAASASVCMSTIAPMVETQTVFTTVASGVSSPFVAGAGVVTSPGTQAVAVTTVISHFTSPVSSVSFPKGQVSLSASSLLSHGSVVQGREVTSALKASPGVVSPSQTVTVSHPSPVSVPQVIVLSSTPGLSSSPQRSLLTSSLDAPVSVITAGTPCSLPQTVSSSGSSLLSKLCASGTVPVTITSLPCVSTTPSVSMNLQQPTPVISQQNSLVTLSPKTDSTVMTQVVDKVAGSMFAKTNAVVPSLQSVNVPVRVPGSVPSGPGVSQCVQKTEDISCAASGTNYNAHENHSGGSSTQRQVSVPVTAPLTVTQSAHKRNSTKPVILKEIKTDKHLLSKTQAAQANLSSSREAESSVKDCGHDQLQSNTRESGRSRRNVVSRDYKVFAGYSSKAGASNRKGSASRTAVMESSSVNHGQMADTRSPQVSRPLKRPAVDVAGDQPQSKVALTDCSVDVVQARQTSAISMCDPQPALIGRTAAHTTALKEATTVPRIVVKAVEACAAAQRLEPAPQTSHSLLSNQENVVVGRSTEDDGEMKVDSGCAVIALSQPEHPSLSLSSGSGVHSVFDSFSAGVQSREADSVSHVELSPKVSSPRSKGNAVVSASSKSPLKHSDRNIVHQFLADSNGSAEKSPKDSPVVD